MTVPFLESDNDASYSDESFSPDSSEDFPQANELQHWIRRGRHEVVDPATETRLDRYLSARFTYRTRTQWVQIIKCGRVRVNGQVCRPSQAVRVGSLIEYDPEEVIEPEVDRNFEIIHDDEAVFAVNKPGDLPVHPSGRYFRHTLLSILLVERGETLDHPGLRVVHRLDRETSGVVVFGKSRAATGHLAKQFAQRSASKRYLAVVHGCPTEDEFVVDAPLGPRRNSRIRKAVGVVPEGEGKTARTSYKVLSRGRDHSLLEARPLTGRLHQIRVHIQHAGFPIVGDKMYGLSEDFFLTLAEGKELTLEDRERLQCHRQALHAFQLRLTHPSTGEAMVFRAPLPLELEDLCRENEIHVPADLLGRND